MNEAADTISLISTSKSSSSFNTSNSDPTSFVSNERNGTVRILGNPGATSRDDAIFLGESLLQVLNSPWELILTEPLPEVVEFHSADWAEKYFSAQSARSSSRVTLSPSYTKQFCLSVDLVAWPVQREDCRGEFQKKIFNEVEEVASLNMWARNQCSSINFLGGFIESIS